MGERSVTQVLESARYMLARAQHHAADFDAQHDAFMLTDPYTHVVEVDADTGEEVHKYRLTKPIPPMLNGIASDALCNIRSGLDQAIYAAVKAHDPAKKGRDTHFPFGENAPDFEGCRNRGSREIPDEVFAVIKPFEPYAGGKGAILWAMAQLCNANKHKILVPIASVLGSAVGVALMQNGRPIVRVGPRWDPVKREIELARMVPGMTADYQMDVTTLIAFDNPAVERRAVQDVLAEMIGQATRIIDAIEAEGISRGFFT